jgi:hypothetical protein
MEPGQARHAGPWPGSLAIISCDQKWRIVPSLRVKTAGPPLRIASMPQPILESSEPPSFNIEKNCNHKN